jgi:carbon monoxide dehydrogenase subunit G
VTPVLVALPVWVVLQQEQVLVRCGDLDVDVHCEAAARVDVPADALWAMVEDPSTYAQVYPSIAATELQSDGSYRVDVRLPWPLPSWPLTVMATRRDGHGSRVLELTDVGGGVGVWSVAQISVTPMPTGSMVEWSWTGPPHYPGWARARIHKTFGHNAVWALAMAAGGEPVAP